MQITHPFVSAIADDPVAAAAGEVVPSNWNAAHTITSAASTILGNPTGSAGNVSEITLGSGLSFSGTTLIATGGGVVSFTSPNSTLTVAGTTTLTADINLSNPNTWLALQTLEISDSATNTVTNALVLTHDTSGTAAANFGTGLLFNGQSSTTANRNMAAINAVWTTATDASRASQVQIQTVVGAAALSTQLTIGGINAATGLTVGGLDGAGGGIWPNAVTPTGTNYAFYSSQTLTQVNAPSGHPLVFSIANSVGMTLTSSRTLGIGTATTGTANFLTVSTNNTVDNSAVMQVNSAGVGNKGLVVQGFSGQTGNLFEVQNSSGTAYVTAGPPTLTGGSTTSNFLNVTATLPTVLTAEADGVNFQITSAGSSSQGVVAFKAFLLAGYTGSAYTVGSFVNNLVAGTGTGSWTLGNANYGTSGQTLGIATGHNIGNSAAAGGSSSLNIAGLNTAFFTTNSPAINVGSASLALNATVNVGGFFGLMATAPTLTSAALIADNGATSSPPFLARVNGTAKFEIDANGLPNFLATNTTGAGITAIGTNCPAVTASAPYTWIQAVSADGSTIFIPAWK